ncbi:hypothetical protein E4U31_008163, partial [Claviceps sp. LM219 group G6]
MSQNHRQHNSILENVNERESNVEADSRPKTASLLADAMLGVKAKDEKRSKRIS